MSDLFCIESQTKKKKEKKKIRGRNYNRATRNDDAIYELGNTDVLPTLWPRSIV